MESRNGVIKLTILYLGTRGGGVLDTFGLVKALSANQDIDCSVILSSKNPLIEDFLKNPRLNIHKIVTNSPTIQSLIGTSVCIYWASMLLALKRSQPQVILITMLHPWVVIVPTFIKIFLPKSKIVYVRHNPPEFENVRGKLNRLLQVLDDYMTRKADFIFTFSDYVRNVLIEEKVVVSQKVKNIGYGLYQSFKGDGYRKKFFKDGPLKVLFIGRILPYKGVEVLLKSLVILKEQGADIHSTIAGEGELSDSQKEIDYLGSSLRLENRWVSDSELKVFINDADVIIAPYVKASQSGPVNLAVTFGVPLIVSNAGGLPELVLNGVTGLVVQKNDSKALAEAILHMSKNREALELMSERTIVFGETELTWDAAVERAVLSIKDLIGS